MGRLEREWARLGFVRQAEEPSSKVLERALGWALRQQDSDRIQKEVTRLRDSAVSFSNSFWNYGSDMQAPLLALDDLHRGIEGGHLAVQIDPQKEAAFREAALAMKVARKNLHGATDAYHDALNEAYRAVGVAVGTLHGLIWGT